VGAERKRERELRGKEKKIESVKRMSQRKKE
jgi:hypothetical protein